MFVFCSPVCTPNFTRPTLSNEKGAEPFQAGADGKLTYSGPMLEVEQWPALREPVMLVALTGWVDGGLAGTGTLAAVAEALDSPRKFASIDLADLLDLQQTRPSVKLVDGVTRRSSGRPSTWWPVAGCDVIIVAGPEPSVRWRT